MTENGEKVATGKTAKINEFNKALEEYRTNKANLHKERDELADLKENIEEGLKLQDVGIEKLVDKMKNSTNTMEAWLLVLQYCSAKMCIMFLICGNLMENYRLFRDQVRPYYVQHEPGQL